MTAGLREVGHVGIVVPDLDTAMDEYAELFSTRWTSVAHRYATMRTAAGETDVALRIAWSLDGPTHVELVEERPGTPWTAAGSGPLHHVAYWVDDLVAEARTLEAAGYAVEVTRAGPYPVNMFAYCVAPDGLRVELMSPANRPVFARWLAGGPLD